MNRREFRAAAKKTGKKSGSPGLLTPAALYETALGHFRAGRYLEAQLCGQKALAQDPKHADSLHLMSLVSLNAQQHEIAIEFMVAAIRQDPKPAYLTSLGVVLIKQGRREEGLKAFEKAVQIQPDNAELWKNLGDVLEQLERSVDAILSFQQALKLDPHFWEAAYKSAFLFRKLGRFEEALAQFVLCDGLRPDQATTLHMCAVTLRDLDRLDESLAYYGRAYELDPANADICNHFGDALLLLGRYEEALPWFDRALALDADSVPALKGKAAGLGNLRRFDESFALYDRLKKIAPDDVMAKWNQSMFHMVLGNFEDGLIGREARWLAFPSKYPKFPHPMWLGQESIEGKTILVLTDEGIGDAIQFARYMPMLAARGARVLLIVQDAIHPLLSGMAGVAECRPVSAGVTSDSFDIHCPMCSLPLAFATRLDSIPAEIPYLPPLAPARVQAWQDRLQDCVRDRAGDRVGHHDKLRVGLVWSGNPKHKNDRNRSLPLQKLLPLLDLDATFISLQKNPKPADQAILDQRSDILDLTSDFADFVETAALVSCLDVVITVDTSVAHLSAAMGQPTWILLPYMPDFRWLLDREDSPWYPAARLFRQGETRDYAEVIERVKGELQKLIAAKVTYR